MPIIVSLVLFMAVLGVFWSVHRRQKRQLRQLMSRLEALEQDPDALAHLLATLAEQHPDSPLVAEMALQMRPSGEAGGIAEAVAELLNHR